MRLGARWALATLVVGAAACPLAPAAAAAPAAPAVPALGPTGVVVSPLLAPSGTPVSVTGSGCAGPVQVTVRVRGAQQLEVVQQVDAAPDAGGAWSAGVAMPQVPGVLAATCDGAEGPEVVFSPPLPFSGDSGRLLPDGRVEVVEVGLVEGSTYRVLDPDGTELAAVEVSGGTGRVVLPWDADRPAVVTLALVGQEPNSPVPSMRNISMPLKDTAAISTHVTEPGAPVVLSGTGCPGSVRVLSDSRTNGLDPRTPHYVDAGPAPAADGSWRLAFAAPREVIALYVTCDAAPWHSETHVLLLGVLGGPTYPSRVTLTTAGARVLLARESPNFFVRAVEAWTTSSRPVAVSFTGQDPPQWWVVDVVGRPGRVVFLATVEAEEGMEWEHAGFPLQWEATIADPAPPEPPDPPDPADPSPPAAPAATAVDDGSTAPGALPATGSAGAALGIGTGLGLVFAGLALLRLRRLLTRSVHLAVRRGRRAT